MGSKDTYKENLFIRCCELQGMVRCGKAIRAFRDYKRIMKETKFEPEIM